MGLLDITAGLGHLAQGYDNYNRQRSNDDYTAWQRQRAKDQAVIQDEIQGFGLEDLRRKQQMGQEMQDAAASYDPNPTGAVSGINDVNRGSEQDQMLAQQQADFGLNNVGTTRADVLRKQADVATKHGDVSQAIKIMGLAKALENEGASVIADGFMMDRNPIEIANEFNETGGQVKIVPQTLRRDPNTGVAMAKRIDGSDFQMNVDTYNNLRGAAKDIYGKMQAAKIKSAEEKAKLDYEYKLKTQLEQFKSQFGTEKTTELMANMNHLVKTGVAKDPMDAFGKLRERMSKPDDEKVTALAMELLKKSPLTYHVAGGGVNTDRAMQDARKLIMQSDAPQAAPAAPTVSNLAQQARNAIRLHPNMESQIKAEYARRTGGKL